MELMFTASATSFSTAAARYHRVWWTYAMAGTD